MSDESGYFKDWLALRMANGKTTFVNPARCRVWVDSGGRVNINSEGVDVPLAKSARRDVVLAALGGDERAIAMLDPEANRPHGEMPAWQVAVILGLVVAGFVVYALVR